MAAALKQCGRVHAIILAVTSSLLEKFCTSEVPFPYLEELVLLSQDSTQLTLPSTFRWGPRLRRLHSTRIAFPALPRLLSSSRDLVYLELHEITSIDHLSPKAFANALSGMTQLQSLSLHFLSPTSRPSHIGISPPPVERVVLPALTRLKFRGTSEYLNSLVTRTRTSRLLDIEVRLFNQLIFHLPQLARFVDQIMQRLSRRADIQSSSRAISITFSQPEVHERSALQIYCEQLDWQLSSMAQICGQLSSSGFFCGVGDLRIDATRPLTGPTRWQDDSDTEYWQELIHSFSGVERFSLPWKLVTDFLGAFKSRPAVGITSSFPALKLLRIEGSRPDYLSQATIHSSVNWHPVGVEYVYQERGKTGLD